MSIMAVISDFYNSQMPRHRRISKNSNNKKGPFDGLFFLPGVWLLKRRCTYGIIKKKNEVYAEKKSLCGRCPFAFPLPLVRNSFFLL